MVAVPAAIPVTIPVEPMVATDVVPVLQVPPEELLLNVVVEPWHNPEVPVIAPGSGLTVTVVVYTPLELQPVLLTVNE